MLTPIELSPAQTRQYIDADVQQMVRDYALGET
jgi:hypothetical protein